MYYGYISYKTTTKLKSEVNTMSNNRVNQLLKQNVVTDIYVQSVSYNYKTYYIKLSQFPEKSVANFLHRLFGHDVIFIW